MKLKLDSQSAEELRKLAKKLPQTIEELDASTEKLIAEFNSVSQDIGVHADAFQLMLDSLKKHVCGLSDEVQAIASVYEQTADKIEDYLASNPT